MGPKNPVTPGPETIDTLIANLFGGEDERAESAAVGLGQLGAAALPSLEAALASEDPERRWWALRALAEIDSPEVPGLLAVHLADPDPAVRHCAALGLVRRPHPEAIPRLVEMLADQDRQLAGLARRSLAACGGTAIPALLGCAHSPDPGARLEAFRALAEIADRRAVPVFFKALQEGDSALIEYWAEYGLEKMGLGMAFFEP